MVDYAAVLGDAQAQRPPPNSHQRAQRGLNGTDKTPNHDEDQRSGQGPGLTPQHHREQMLLDDSATLQVQLQLNTCGRGAGTHGDVLNVHTEAFGMNRAQRCDGHKRHPSVGGLG